MLSFVYPDGPKPGDEPVVPPSLSPDEEIIDEPEYFPFDEPVPDLPTEERAVTPGQTRGAYLYQAVIPEDPRHPDPTEYPPIPPRDPDEPPPIEEPAEPGIPLEDPPADPDDLPGDEPMIDPPPPQAGSRVALSGAFFS